METQNNDNQQVQVNETNGYELAEAREKASIDVHISTAKRYPRDVKKSTNQAITIATMDQETAQSCGYALPRAGKHITGPSVHLARIVAQCWGNIRIQTQVKHILAKHVVTEAVAWDLENNYAIKAEVRKKIIDRHGKRYNDDMITTTANAASAIAERNAILRVIPQAITQKVYKETRNLITGDISDETKLIKRRKEALDYFKEQYGVTENQILKTLGLGSTNAIKQDQIVRLLELDQSIKDGDAKLETIFEPEYSTSKEKTKQSKNQKISNNEKSS
jgi:hypothetical protein